MKRMMPALFVCLALLVCCSKSTLQGKNLQEQITGRWRYAQSYYSIGGPLIYVSTENLRQWIEFEKDGSFFSNMPGFEKMTHYTVQDSITIKFTGLPSQPAERYHAFVNPSDKSMSLSSADFICIEGCGSRFKK